MSEAANITLTDGTAVSQKKLWSDLFAMIAALRKDPDIFVREINFEPRQKIAIVCVDGRVQLQNESPLDKMDFYCLPGSGITLGGTREQSLRLAANLLRGKVHVITWHRGCGAAKAAMEKFGLTGNVDDFAREFAEDLSKLLGVRCLEARLVGPLDFHLERGVVYDATNRYHASPKNPPMFVVTREQAHREVAMASLLMAIDIAMSHGFGKSFEQQPFVVFVLAKTQDQLKNLLAEVESQSFDRNRIEILGAVAGS